MQITRTPFRLTRVGAAARFVTRAALDVLYPVHCPVCRISLGPGGPRICSDCWSSLDVIEAAHCRRCGCPGEFAGPTCPNCKDKSFYFSRLRSLAPFSEDMQHLIHGIKYQNRTSLAEILGRRLGQLLEGEMAVDLVVPVPLHASRKRERGYNQSALLGTFVAAVLGVPLAGRHLRRDRATPSQTSLDLDHRATNVAGAFEVHRPAGIRNQRLLLVDDVVTTGATANACADALLNAGAGEICVAALASPYLDSATPTPT